MSYQRAQLGHFVFLSVFTESKTTRNTAGTPDAAPTYSIYDSSDTAVVSDKPLPKLGYDTTAHYGMDLLLGSAYAAGSYCVHYKWQEGGTNVARISPFEVLGGSPSSKGVYTSLCWYDRPQAKFLIGATEDGTIEYRRNPYVT